MQTWSHAGQANNDNVMSAVPVVIALLLKLLSQSLDLVPYGLGICRTLIQKRQLELISRNLSADKGKAFIISPTLRMLREAISFDGGAVAKPIFRARASTFKSLSRNMGIVHIGGEAEDLKRPSARTNAVQFFLSAIRYLHPDAKKELLSQRDIVSALTRDIKQDQPYLVLEILDGLRNHVLLDSKVPREAKSSLLGAATLIKISALYYYRQSVTDDLPSIPDAAHEFLMTACTNPSSGVLRQDNGFYPREADPNASIPAAELDELGLEAIVWMNSFKSEVPVRNYVLSNFLQQLRPWSSVKQNELVTAIFKVAPELVADFFINNKSFTFEPKLSATWIGYAAFLFNTVALPLPDFFLGRTSSASSDNDDSGSFAELPPPTSIVVDNILPLPMTQKVLTRCLANKSKMVSFFATRILVLALEKLDEAVKMHLDERHANKALWEEAARRLVDEFCQRSPGIKDMINAYRSIGEGDVLHREAASRLLRLCYEVLPQVALMAKFDVGPFLEAALGKLAAGENGEEKKTNEAEEEEEKDPRDAAMRLKELENLLAIAGYSPGMRWFTASEALTLSPFTGLLKVYVDAPKGVALASMRQVLDFVAAEQQLIAATGSQTGGGLFPLIESIQGLKQNYQADLWSFLDKCLTKCATAPIKYLEMMLDLVEETGADAGAVISPVALAMLEQLPFAVKAADKGVLDALRKFLPKFLGASAGAGESKVLTEAVFAKMATHFTTKGLGKLTIKESKKGEKSSGKSEGADLAVRNKKTSDPETEGKSFGTTGVMSDEHLQDLLLTPDSLAVDNSALVKWSSKTVDEIVDDGYAVSLISLLASDHVGIRKEALVNILKMAAKLKQSEYEEKEQVWLLLSELAETAREPISEGRVLPGPIVAFACHALTVLRDPLHGLYPKVNTFLTKGPVWRLDWLPLVDEVVGEEPVIGGTGGGGSESYYGQLGWLLGYLTEGLRTEADLELFHKKRAKGPVFERLLALADNPYMRTNMRRMILQLVYRATGIKGGSTTLTTRFGVISWLEQQEGLYGSGEEEKMLYKALRRRVWETCDQARVGEWSRNGVEGRL